jgi:acetyl-CoA C-acetyltransferase
MMTDRVGIVAVAQTEYEPSKPELSHTEMVYELVEHLLEETGLSFADDGTGIDSTVSCSHDAWDGRTISSQLIQSVAGAHLRPEEKVAGDGSVAVYYAAGQVLSGDYDVVLVTAHCKESETDPSLIENSAFDPIFMRMLGLDFVSAAALAANRYMNSYGITREQCSQVVVKNRGNAVNNPFAQEPMELSVDDVLGSEMLVDPIRRLDTKPVSDGACALIVATEEKAKRLTNRPVWIEGLANCYDAHYLGERDLADCEALQRAARRAYSMAGITNPIAEIDLVELSDVFSYQELLWLEGLGFCERGEAGRLIDQSVTAMGGELPVNPSGGILSGNPAVVAGMARVAEVALQLRGEAGARQVDDAERAVAHGTDGICGQMHCVLVLGR